VSLTIVRRKVSDLFPVAAEGVREFLRQEVIPVVREIRDRFNLLATGPYDFGTVMSGHGAPVDAPSADRAIYIDLDGGALTTLYVWNGAAWEAK
jgi:hypothetical protein